MSRIRIAQGVLVLIALAVAFYVFSGGASYGDDDACRDYGISCD